jgi:hypothetical protein
LGCEQSPLWSLSANLRGDRAPRLHGQPVENAEVIFVNPASQLPSMKVPSRLQPVPTEEEMKILLSQAGAEVKLL